MNKINIICCRLKKTVEIGDMIMCVSDSATFNNSHWSVIQTNINGTVNVPLTQIVSVIKFNIPPSYF